MADIRIKDLTTTASTTAADDFFAADGATNGTRKLSAFSPSFGGNATVSGTLTVSGTGVSGGSITTTGTSPSRVHQIIVQNGSASGVAAALGGLQLNAQPGYSTFVGVTGNGTSASYQGGILGSVVIAEQGYIVSDAAQGLLIHAINNDINFATGNPGTQRGYWDADGLRVQNTTASTTTSSGALVVGNGTSGGLGVGGSAFIGGALNMYGEDFNIHNVGYGSWTLRNTAGSAVFDIRNGAGSWLTFPGAATGTVEFKTLATTVKVAATTASTTTSSGALVVSGGVGVAKELYVGSATESTSNTTGGLVLSGGLGVALNLNMGGRLFINNTSAANGTLSSSGIVSTFGADGVLGGLGFTVKGFPSATAGSRYIQLAAGDNADYRELRINDLGGNVLLGGATSTVKIGGSFQVGNAYVGGAPTATGYIVIKDSTGTSYKIPAVAL
jgi:hypothetical protein